MANIDVDFTQAYDEAMTSKPANLLCDRPGRGQGASFHAEWVRIAAF